MSKAVFSILCIISVGLVFQAHHAPAQSFTNISVERMKTEVYRFGTGEKAKVVVRKSDGTKLKGYISSTGDDTFELTDSKSKRTSIVAYTEVAKIKKQGMSTAAQVMIIAGVSAAVAAVAVAVAVNDALNDPCFLWCAP